MPLVGEQYGSYASIEQSEAQAGVSTETNLYFFGSCPSGEVGKVYYITSYADAVAKLGITDGGMEYTLAQAAVAAFQIVGIGHAYFIPLSNTAAYDASWVGDADSESGVYVYNRILRESPGVVNILCAPGVTDGAFLQAMLGLCVNGEGIKSYAVYDLPCGADDISSTTGFPDPEIIVANKNISSEYASAVWGTLETAGGQIISGAAVRSCLLARADAEYNAPARVGGYLNVANVVGMAYEEVDEDTQEVENVAIDMRKSEADVLSANGVNTFFNLYSQFISYGDHTSAYSNGAVTDERGRWESCIRLLAMFANWFILTFAFIIDEPMTLQLRNDILAACQRFLNGLVAIGAVIGEPSVEFIPAENPVNNLARGEFVFSIKMTTPAVVKVLKAKVRYSDAGLSVYQIAA